MEVETKCLTAAELTKVREKEYQDANELAGAMGERAREAIRDIILAVMPHASDTFHRTMIASVALAVAMEEPEVVQHHIDTLWENFRTQKTGWQNEPSPEDRKKLAGMMYRGN